MTGSFDALISLRDYEPCHWHPAAPRCDSDASRWAVTGGMLSVPPILLIRSHCRPLALLS